MSLTEQTATELLAKLNDGELSSVEITQAYLDRIDAEDGQINAFLHVDAEGALARATSIDQRRAKGEQLGILAGLPVAVKDLVITKGRPTTCASKMLEKFVSPYNGTVAEKLLAADAVIIGKTNMDEFAMGGSTETSAFGVTHNPWDLDRTPGGSSGGAAACVAASMAPLSIGSDTGGSIRQPASFCGVVGLKPSYGRVSRFGLVAFASSLDQIGPLAHTVEDTALLLEAIAGHDPMDSTSANVPVPSYRENLAKPLEGLKLGVVAEHFGDGVDSATETAVRDAIKIYESLGAKVQEIHLPHNKYAIATYYIIAPCEASSNLARYDGVHYGRRTDEAAIRQELKAEAAERKATGKTIDRADTPLVRMYRNSRSEGFGDEVKRRIMLGTYALSSGYYDAYYVKGLKVRRLIRQDYIEAFKDVDLLIGPVSPTTAFKLGEKSDDPLSMYLGDLFTVSANLAGMAGISLPCGLSPEGLPIGVQLQAPSMQEEKLLRAAHMFQQATDHHTKRPSR